MTFHFLSLHVLALYTLMIFTHCTHSQSKSTTQTCSQATQQPKKDQASLFNACTASSFMHMHTVTHTREKHTQTLKWHTFPAPQTHSSTHTHTCIYCTSLRRVVICCTKINRSAQKHSSCERAHTHTPLLDIHKIACTHHRTCTHTRTWCKAMRRDGMC